MEAATFSQSVGGVNDYSIILHIPSSGEEARTHYPKCLS